MDTAQIWPELTRPQATIKSLILERFDIFNARQQEEEARTEQDTNPAPTTNGYHAPSPKSPTPTKSPAKRQAPEETVSDVIDESPPKKMRKEASVDADAVLAARLQAEEDKRARPTRGGSSRKAAPVKKKTPKKKTAARIRGSDESDVEDSQSEKKPKNTGFNVSMISSILHHHLIPSQKPMSLSTPLSELLEGEVAVGSKDPDVCTYANARSCLGHNASNVSGNTFGNTVYRIHQTREISFAMSQCVRCSSRTKSTCSL